MLQMPTDNNEKNLKNTVRSDEALSKYKGDGGIDPSRISVYWCFNFQWIVIPPRNS